MPRAIVGIAGDLAQFVEIAIALHFSASLAPAREIGVEAIGDGEAFAEGAIGRRGYRGAATIRSMMR